MRIVLMTAFAVVAGLMCAGPVRGQACGGSAYTFTVHVRNGTEAKNVRYRVFPVKRVDGKTDTKMLRNTFASETDPDARPMQTWSYPGFRADPEKARSFIRTYNPKLYKPQDTTSGQKNMFEGLFKDATATFFTSETDNTPYFLEISADGHQSVYIIGAIMGGCRQHEDIILQANTSRG